MNGFCVWRWYCLRKFRLALVWLGLLLGSLYMGNGMAASTITSAQSGFWDVTTTWVGGVAPVLGDRAIIASGHTVTVRANTVVNEVTIDAGGILQGNGGGPWTFTCGKGGGVDFTVDGTLDFGQGKAVTIVLSKNALWTGAGTWNLSGINYQNRTLSTAGVTQLNFSGNATPVTGTSGSVTSAATTVWNFTGSVAQTLPNTASVQYGSIRVSNSSTVTLGLGLNAANLLAGISVQSGTLANGGFAIVGTAGSTFNVANGATFLLTGTSVMPTGFGSKIFGTTLPTCSTVNYGGTSQTVSNEAYGNLTLSGSGTKTMPATAMAVACDFSMSGSAVATTTSTLAVGRDFTMSGTSVLTPGNAITVTRNMTLGAGTTFTAGSYTHNVGGNFTNNGATFTANTSTINLNGTTAQTIGGTTGTTFYRLTVNNAAGASLSSVNTTVSNVLTLTSGVVTTGANNLIASATCPASIVRTGGWVFGNLRLTFPATNPVTCIFHVGDASNYSPITVTKTGANSGTLTGSSTAGDHADTTAGTSGISASRGVNRYWMLTGGTLASGTPYSATFQFCNGTGAGCGINDVDAGANTANFIVAKKTGGIWTLPTVGSATSTATQATGLTTFGEFAVGEPAMDHYEMSLQTSGITCLASTVTVTACADSSSPCTTPFTAASGTTATLITSAGTLAATTVTFNASGVASTTLSYPAASDGATALVTLSGEQAAATNPRKCCPDGVSCVVSNSCSTTFNTAGFIFSAAADGAVALIPTQVAGTSSSTFYLRAVKTSTITKACESALAGANTVNFAYECNNPTTCYTSNLMSVNGGIATDIARNNNGSVSSYTSVSMAFDANGNAPFTFNYRDVGQVTLHVNKTVNSAPLAGVSNAFVVKPFGFVLPMPNIQQTAAPNLVNSEAANAGGDKFVKAGESFSATVSAVTATGSMAYNYGKEVAAEGVILTNALVAPASGVNPILGNPSAFGAFSGGAATGTTFNWSEVGIITLTPSVADGNYLGVGNITGTTSGNVGRFYPDHFIVSLPTLTNRILSACASSFTYAGEQMQSDFTLTARNGLATPTPTQNYTTASGFAKLDGSVITNFGFGAVDLADATPPLTATARALGLVSSSGNWLSGAGAFTARLGVNRAASPDGPYESFRLGIYPTDSDGVTLRMADLDLDTTVPADGSDRAQVGSSMVRFGRLKLSNAHGSELLNLPIPIETQYWNGTVFVTNSADNCTTLNAANMSLSNYQPATGALTVANMDTPAGSHISLGGAFIAGRGTLKLLKPTGGITSRGSVTLTENLAAGGENMTYLQGAWTGATYTQNPSALATFGVYKGGNEFIYQRENY